MVDEGLEEIQEKNNVGQKLHKKHFLSLMGGDSYRNALLIKGLLSTAKIERLRMYRREIPPAALSRTDQTAEE